MKLSIVIPVFNEINTIQKILARIQKVEWDKEIIIVDDGSTDGTRECIQEKIQPQEIFKVAYHDRNLGKGAALKTGFDLVAGDIVIIQDADLEYDPRDYEQLLEPILDGRADVVYGSRFLGGPHRVLLFWHYVGNRFLTLLSNMFNNINLTDMETCYKVFRKEVLDGLNLKSCRFGFEPEFTAKVARRNYRIYEVPISYSGRTYDEGKKITWLDGIKAIFAILWFRFFD